MNIQCAPFGETQSGRPVGCYTLTSGLFSANILTYGAALQSLSVPDRDGQPVDIVLGFDTVHGYESQAAYIGATVGRCANRISGGRFRLGERAYTLACNENGINHLHGGQCGFDKRLWTASVSAEGLMLRYHSPNGEEGYPGALDACVTYRLQDGGLFIDYRAAATATTLCNLTNHSYFNLAGHASGDVGAQTLTLEADWFTPIDKNGVPTGEINNVEGTPMDFRTPHALAARWDDAFLTGAGGYDHNYIIRGKMGALRPAARVCCDATGIVMEVSTTSPGVQLYTGNFLTASPLPCGKGGASYQRRAGFCLETQYYPGAPAFPHFPQPILEPGQIYHEQTLLQFKR